MVPIAGLSTSDDARPEHDIVSQEEQTDEVFYNPLPTCQERHHAKLVELIATEVGADARDIIDFEMMLYDTQRAVQGGLNNEFILGSRLGNLVMSYCAVEGLLQYLSSSDIANTVSLVALFDDEEIGSETAQGATSTFLASIIQRICLMTTIGPAADSIIPLHLQPATFQRSLRRSFAVSADMAHSTHPNYPSKYEPNHKPRMNHGVVIKANAKGRYSADSPGIALMEEVARRSKPASHCQRTSQGVPLQLFVARNDSTCGSTIGPVIASALGMRTVDVGNAQLSMHSIREMAGAHDIENAVNLFESFFWNYGDLELSHRAD